MASPGASVPKDCGSAHGLGGCDIGRQAMLGRELADGRESEGSPALSPPAPPGTVSPSGCLRTVLAAGSGEGQAEGG